MAKLDVPGPVRMGLLRIASLTDEQFQGLASSLDNLPLKIMQRGVFDYEALKSTVISSDDLSYIRQALFPLYLAQGRIDVPINTYADDIAQSLQVEPQTNEQPISGETTNRLKERLRHLLSLERPRLISKARDVLTGQTPAYSDGRIFTDIRPVFTEDIEAFPQFAVLVHVLKIDYYKDGDEREFVVALDAKDIQKLIDLLERAKKKSETVRSVTSSAGLSIIDIG